MKDALPFLVLIGMLFTLALGIAGFDAVKVQAQRATPDQAQLNAVWEDTHGEVNIAFRDGSVAFDAVTLALEGAANQASAALIARDIARNLGVIGEARELGDNAIEDTVNFKALEKIMGQFSISDENKQSVLDSVKAFPIIEGIK